MESSLRNLYKNPAVLLFILVLVIYTFCLNAIWATDHTTSFLELAWAIWNNHSFALAKVSKTIMCPGGGYNPIQYSRGIYCTVDDFSFNGNYYSALAPGTAVLMLPFTAAGFIADKGFDLYAQPLVYSEFFIALINSIATVAVYKISKLYFRTSTSVFLAFAYAFSTISWPFATFIFQSDPSAAFDLIAAFFALKIGRSGLAGSANPPKLKEILFCGLALTAAITIDYLNIVLFPIFLFYILYSLYKQSNLVFARDFVTFILSSVLAVVFVAGYNYFSFGNPLTTSEQLYSNGKGMLALFPQGIDYGLFLNLLSPYRGLFFYSPILILGVYGFYKMLKSKNYDKEGILLLALFCGILFPYSKWYLLDGGLSYGPRFIVPSIPFLLIPIGFVIDGQKKRITKTVAYALYAIGVVTNGIAALTSALASTSNSWLRSPFLYSALPAFLKGSFDSWFFASLAHESAWALGGVMIVIALVSPLIPFWILGKHESPSGTSY